jgi:hypothetical protein
MDAPSSLWLRQFLLGSQKYRFAAGVPLVLRIEGLEDDLPRVHGVGGFAVEGNAVEDCFKVSREEFAEEGYFVQVR